jgi:hypothetical protein
MTRSKFELGTSRSEGKRTNHKATKFLSFSRGLTEGRTDDNSRPISLFFWENALKMLLHRVRLEVQQFSEAHS